MRSLNSERFALCVLTGGRPAEYGLNVFSTTPIVYYLILLRAVTFDNDHGDVNLITAFFGTCDFIL